MSPLNDKLGHRALAAMAIVVSVASGPCIAPLFLQVVIAQATVTLKQNVVSMLRRPIQHALSSVLILSHLTVY